jgi:carbamoyl-phosphate synthase/aspartate carbamoyltransferase/dihydroorotase
MLILPGLIDPHVHLREPGGTHKEDWYSGTCAALAGGITTVLAMPNTKPPLVDTDSLALSLNAAAQKAVCDYGVYACGTAANADTISNLSHLATGLKLYLDDTYGQLLLDWRDLNSLNSHFANWHSTRPLVCHAEARSIPAAILLAQLHNRPVHIAHVSRASEIACIWAAKEKGLPVTCEVAPHHLFLSTIDIPKLGRGRCEVRPRLATPADQAALWHALQAGVIDCIATDHAPHLLSEKDSENPPPGFPSLDVSLALMLQAVWDGRLQIGQLVALMADNPRQIFGLPTQPDTYVEVDPELRWIVRGADSFSRCKWSPFEGWELRGKVVRVVLRGQLAFEADQILATAGSGQWVGAS